MRVNNLNHCTNPTHIHVIWSMCSHAYKLCTLYLVHVHVHISKVCKPHLVHVSLRLLGMYTSPDLCTFMLMRWHIHHWVHEFKAKKTSIPCLVSAITMHLSFKSQAETV